MQLYRSQEVNVYLNSGGRCLPRYIRVKFKRGNYFTPHDLTRVWNETWVTLLINNENVVNEENEDDTSAPFVLSLHFIQLESELQSVQNSAILWGLLSDEMYMYMFSTPTDQLKYNTATDFYNHLAKPMFLSGNWMVNYFIKNRGCSYIDHKK